MAGDPDEVISIPSDSHDDRDGDSTVDPHNSVSNTSTVTLSSLSGSDECSPSVRKYLEEGVVEVHDVCLAVTQRYLEALRVNWELRHGCGVIVVPLGRGPIRRKCDRAAERGSPYLRASPRRRAASQHGGLGHIDGSCFHGDDGPLNDTAEDSQGRGNHIPRPTNSLLQNISYICDLIWRRAQRDREDVLGAETCGCRDMGFLLECAEAVVLYDAGEWERDPESGFGIVCQAGRDLCREVDDIEGIERVDDIEFGRT